MPHIEYEHKPVPLASYAPVLEALTREGSFLTAGSAAQINRNAERYDAIYSPWASEE